MSYIDSTVVRPSHSSNSTGSPTRQCALTKGVYQDADLGHVRQIKAQPLYSTVTARTLTRRPRPETANVPNFVASWDQVNHATRLDLRPSSGVDVTGHVSFAEKIYHIDLADTQALSKLS